MSNRTFQKAIIILADGACADVMNEELGKGNLPNIARHLVEAGSNLSAVTAFPSTTGPAYLPFLTGCLPGTCNVPGIRWFDKAKYSAGWSFDRYRSYVGFESFCMASDMRPGIKTIFELVPDSYSIFNPIARGAKGKRNFTRISRIWHWYYAHLTDHWSFTDESALKKLKAVIEFSPKFIFTVFPGIDEYSHLAHPKHEKVIERYKWLDLAVGDVVKLLISRGEWDETALFLVSDHGLSKTHTHFCVNEFLERQGLPPFYYPLIHHKRGKLSANMVSGNSMAHIYFKNRDGWSRHTAREELERLCPSLLGDMLEHEAIDIVAVRNAEGGADILSKRGHAKVILNRSRLHYETIGSDPFGYPELSRDLGAEGSLEKTLDTEYPDAPFAIAHLLTAPRAGDVIVSATPGFDLRDKYEIPEHRSSHGSLHKSHMRVPLISNVRFESKAVRTADVFPTILKLLNLPIPDYVDGAAMRDG